MTTSRVDRPRSGYDAPAPYREVFAPLAGRPGQAPGVSVIALGAAATLAAVGFDLALAGRLTLFFDLCFVVLCLALAITVRERDFFTVAVLPPLLMLVTFLMLAAIRPTALGEGDSGVLQTIVTGLAHHSAALAVGQLLCLGALALRHHRSRAQSAHDTTT